MRAASILGLVLVVGATGACTDDEVEPITRVTGPRVLAVTSEPSALVLGGEAVLSPFVVDPGGPRAVEAVRMRACAPWKFVADPARDCAGADALVLAIDVAGRGVASADALAAAFPAPPGTPAPADPWRVALAAGLALQVPVIVEVDVGGQTLIARRDLTVVDELTPRQNPALAEVRFDGAPTQVLRSGQAYRLTATVARDSLDPRPDPDAAGAPETVDCNFYSGAGDLAEPEVDIELPDVPVPETLPNQFTAGPPGTTWMFVVATDETGGMDAVAVELTVE